jgi:hypothetical protein
MLFSCKQKNTQPPLFQLMENTGVDFINTVTDNDSINILNYRNFYNGGGVAAGDINNDGLPDLFFTANQGANKLYLNKGNFQFEDISEKAGFGNKLQFSTGVVFVDINNDGWLDIYVCNAGNMHHPELRKNQLFINNHDLTFTEKAHEYGLDNDGYTTHASFFDYDMDGDLDCFIINNSPVPVNSLGYPHQRDLIASQWKVEDDLKGGGDHLYRNDNGHFVEVTQQAGIHGTLMSFGLGVTVGDVNGDHYPDVFVSNDFFERDYLYINQRNGTFKDETEQWMQHNSYASMGADFGDINNDGYPDIFTTDMLPADDYRLKTTLSFDDIDQYRLKERNGFYHQFLQNTLQLNNKEGKFYDIANYAGVNASEWSWGALMFDADNDGLTDLYVCNGIYRDLTNQDFLDFDANEIREKMIATGKKNLTELVNKIPSIAVPNKMFRNKGNLSFSDESTNWGLTQNSFSNGAAYADLDNDGDLDLVVNNTNEKCFIIKNNSREQNKNNYIGIQLKGSSSNTFAVGSKILVYNKNEILSKEVIPARGFQSSVDYKQIIGLGKATVIDSLVIIWPNLLHTTIIHPEINKVLQLTQPTSGDKIKTIQQQNSQPVFTEQPNSFSKHVEDDYTDFYAERAIPQMLSAEGPKCAVADINGDGLDDIYIGGSAQQQGSLYIQTNNGFIKKEIPALKQFMGFEDAAVLFFDANGDGYKDLLITAAGNAAMPASRELQHRLLLNDGKANFTLAANAFPINKDNISVIAANDFDGDGDMDLFVGAGCVSKEYGVTPLSHIYINNGKGIFTDMPAAQLNGIDNLGMIKAACWADIDNDGKNELIITGEWMGIQVFKYTNGKFNAIKTNLNALEGWWQSLAVTDINNDGKPDFILGNLGENFSLKPSVTQPVKIFIGDFDDNGRTDKIITRTIDGNDKPLFMKREVQDELPVLKKENLHHAEYATKTIKDLFTAEQLAKTTIKQVNYSSSIIAINKGNYEFEIIKLPVQVQLSSVKAIACKDVNNDGYIDLLLGGNEFNFQPQLGRLDASPGWILLNNHKNGFTVLTTKESGINLSGMVRDIQPVHIKKEEAFIFLQNNEKPVLFRFNKNK